MKDDLIEADPGLAFYLEEAFEQLSPRSGALQPSAAGTDLLGMNLEEELTEEEELRLELESAKRERRALMDSLAALKGDQGKAGSDLQEADISRLRRELEEALKAEGQLVRLALTSRDCAAMMPSGGLDTNERVRALEAELARLETENAETEAQHRLREHMAQDLKAREMREALDAFMEDHAVLTEHMHATRAAREEAERDLATTKAQRDAVRSDWARKLQDRRKEVRSMEHRQKREMAEEEEQRARQAELDAIEREKAAKARLEVEAFEQQLQACARLLCSLSVLPSAMWC
ncbi:g9654 [Coccomyxa elongata]